MGCIVSIDQPACLDASGIPRREFLRLEPLKCLGATGKFQDDVHSSYRQTHSGVADFLTDVPAPATMVLTWLRS
jgi:hypothetical protein